MKVSTRYSISIVFILFILFILFFILFILFTLLYKTLFFTCSGIYHTDILPKDDFDKLLELCSHYNETNMVNDHKASGRLMHIFPVQDPIYKVLFQPKFIQKVRNLCGNPRLVPCLDIPIEYRKYKIGSNMHWHRDTQMLPDQLQYECVITMENTSDSKTEMKKWFGLFSCGISTEPNSILIVRAKGVEHRVTTTTQGNRTILKFVFCEP
jgi:hypothetical protein